MLNVVVSLRVVPEQRERFLEVIAANAAASVRDEPGCYTFQVAEDVNEPNHFLLHEQYRDEEAFEQHRTMPHFYEWRRAAEECLVPGSQVTTRAQLLISESASPA